ncbi:unnamed protein product [Rotaria sp. Silwood2]|nr:unnamed protein product [Rotaria sp. Silwood2]
MGKISLRLAINSWECSLVRLYYVRVKAQIQTTETNSRQSKLLIIDDELDLAAKSKIPFSMAIEPCDNNEEDIEADIALAIDTRKNVKWIKVLASVRRTHLTVIFDNRIIIDDSQSGHLIIENFYQGEKRLIPMEFYNNGLVEYTLCLTSEDDGLIFPFVDLKLCAGERQTSYIEVQISTNVSTRIFNINIDFFNIRRRCKLILTCETAKPSLNYYIPKIEEKHVIIINNDEDKEDIWNSIRNVLNPIKHQVTFINNGKAAATVRFDRILTEQNLSLPSTTCFDVKPNNIIVLPHTETSIDLLYYPNDFRSFNSTIQFVSNALTDPIHIPYHLEFHRPVLSTNPRSVIDIGQIELGKIIRKKLLCIENIGSVELRICFSEPFHQHSLVKTADIEFSSLRSDPHISKENFISINPKKKRWFNVMIEFNSTNSSTLSNVVALCAFQVNTQCDPIINTEGILVNRQLILLIVGHTQSIPSFILPNESERKSWSSLKLLPSSWLYSIHKNYHIYENYIDLIGLIAIAHVCGCQQTKDKLPITLSEWRTFCSNINNQSNISLEMFEKNQNNLNKSLEILSKLLKETNNENNYNYSLFYHLSSFQHSFSSDDTIIIQLFSVINSTNLIDEAYTMQSYVNLFWKFYNQCPENESHRQAIHFVYQCINKDSTMSLDVIKFIEFIYQSLNFKTSTDIINQLSTILPNDDAMAELLTIKIDSNGKFRWPLLFLLISDSIRKIIIQLINEDYLVLLDIHMNLINQQQLSNIWKRTLFKMIKISNNFWNTLTLDNKKEYLETFLNHFPNLISIISEISNENLPELNHILSITKIILQYIDSSYDFHNIELIFQEKTQYSIGKKLLIFPHLQTVRSNIASSIFWLKKSIINGLIDEQARSYQIAEYCDILEQLVQLDVNQWKLFQMILTSLWSLICIICKNDTKIFDIIDKILHFLHIIDIDKQWLLIRDAYKEYYLQPSWLTMLNLTNIINYENEINNFIRKISTHTNEDDVALDVFRLCRCLLTNDEQIKLDQNQIIINNLSINIQSNIDLLKQIENLVSGLIKEKIHLFLQSIKIFQTIPLTNINIQLCPFETLFPLWKILFDINCNYSLKLFESISSILISFHSLVISKSIPFIQQIYTTNMAVALCTLANSRLNNRQIGISTIDLPSVPSIMSIIRTNIIRRHSSPCTTPTTRLIRSNIMPWDNIPLRKLSKTIIPRTSPYSNITLTKMQVSVADYVNHAQQTLIHFKQSDSVQIIIDAAISYHPLVTQWYDAFMTYNVLVRHSLNLNQENQINYGYHIIQYGLKLLRNLIVSKIILESTFTKKGVRFLLDDISHLENCLRSLSLEKYPNLRNTLRLLHIDINRSKFDFKPPSRSLALKGKLVRKFQFDIDSHEITKSLPISEISKTIPLPLIVDHDNIKLSKTDWENAIQHETLKHKNVNLTSTNIIKHRLTDKRNRDVINGVQTGTQRLANDILNQYINMNDLTEIVRNNTTIEDDIESMYPSSISGKDFELQLNLMRDHLKNDNTIIKMYKTADQKVASIVSDGKLDNRPALKLTTEPERWTYQMLIETPAITRMIDLIVRGFRSKWEQLLIRSDPNIEHEIHWCIMIDNSGSMSIHRNAIYESLVVLMELLRKLESKFAVARFGGRTNQKILKNLDDFFTNQDGQYILEALTFDEGTYPATGLARVADRVFPEKKTKTTTNVNIHQCVIMITDGLTRERENTTYTGTMAKYNIDLGILFIETDRQETSEVLLACLKKVQNVVIKSNRMTELPHLIPILLHKMIGQCLKKSNFETELNIIPPTIHIEVPKYQETNPIVNKPSNEKLKYSSANPSSYMISKPTTNIPGLSQVNKNLTEYLSRETDYTDCVSHAINTLRLYYQSLKTKLKILDAEKTWFDNEHRFSALIDDVSIVFDELVFPFNRFTRRRGALRGSSLYMPGVIKAITSDWNYKKIFGAKLAGGKRNHTVCIVIDVSTSMFGTLSIGILDGIVVLIGALRKIGIDNFSIIVFGRNVRLIKTNEQGWDALTIYTLMEELRFDRDDGTKDADGIEAAIDLLGQYSIRGEKKIFILTDGYSSCGNKLALVQQRAEQNGIDLIAMAIGIDKTNLESVYKRYLQCATVNGLPKALRALFEHETRVISLEWSSNNSDQDNKIDRNLLEDLFDEIKSKKIFESMINELADQRHINLIHIGSPPPDIIMDICFCLDCTGSMSRWLDAVKSQMSKIISDIQTAITNKYKLLNLQMRFAVVAYRDVGDDPQFSICDFTDKIEELTRFVNNLKAIGGDDLPEDVLGALRTCLALPSWKAKNARFIVLITDAPGHGELNDQFTDRFPQGVGTRTFEEICDRLLTKTVETDLIFCCIKKDATKKMTEAFYNYYQKKKEQTDKTFTVVYPFTDDEPGIHSYHFVFVLDGSSTMSCHWNVLEKAYVEFLESRKRNQGVDDIFSVVQFSSKAKIVYQRKQFSDAPRTIEQLHGGTNYNIALEEAEKVIEADSTKSSVVMIFMSDGIDLLNNNPAALIAHLKSKYEKDHRFICHTVAFGDELVGKDGKTDLLKAMAEAGGGQLYTALNDNQLINAFVMISTNNKATETLIKLFSDTLTETMREQIMLDFL